MIVIKSFYYDSSFDEEFLNQEDIDLIVTNYSEYLSEYKVSTNCLLLKTVPDKQDWELLFKTIEPKCSNL